MAPVDKEDRRVTPPASGVLHTSRAPHPSARRPPPDTLKCSQATIPPRASTTVAVSVCLCGSIPTTLPASSGVSSRCDGPGPRFLALTSTPPPRRYVVGGPADNITVGAPFNGGANPPYQARPILERT